ncbi:hypothetical protein AIOL_002961 [Candidatus Rhodobacter oscarellae]|uniref:CENP-V/GFA domain-containing protein n=1 Tax=Candidatus Rhodobacter oscarellae TaxID=1675527 RepID=A0A0J9GWT1_9RHOB|nr:DUF6151 family protein [Candidatus Rhodobacter lobularis]KMW57993.1 hypothetical protein AIOL_002961 [Candidatus Rhodobacter lobularis]
MARDLAIACKCGQVSGVLRGITPARGTLCRCYCTDCRAFSRHVGAADSHDAHGGIEIFQTLPGRLEFLTGQEQLRALQITSGGLLRFYAGCCGTQFGNMLPGGKLRFVGLPLPAFPEPDARDVMGPVLSVNCAKEAPGGNAPERSFGYKTAVNRALLRQLASIVFLAPRGFPYFENGQPIADPHVLTEAERAAAYVEDAQ